MSNQSELRGTIFEKLLREVVQICLEEIERNPVASKLAKSIEVQNGGKAEGNGHNLPRLVAVKEWQARHGYPNAAGLRHLMFYGKSNGFDTCVRRIGRRVFIDEERYFEWVENQNAEVSP